MTHINADDETRERAALYALGGLNQFEARAFEQHLDEGCLACALDVAAFDTVVEELAWADASLTPPAEVRGKLLARVQLEAERDGKKRDGGKRAQRERDEGVRDGAPKAKSERTTAPLPAPALPPGLLIVRAGEGAWVETGDAGITAKVLFADRERGTLTTLVKMSPGSRMPRHRHTGLEQCLVLEGDVHSGELSARAGDYICAMPGSVHEELTTEHGNLLLIVAPANYEVLEAI